MTLRHEEINPAGQRQAPSPAHPRITPRQQTYDRADNAAPVPANRQPLCKLATAAFITVVAFEPIRAWLLHGPIPLMCRGHGRFCEISPDAGLHKATSRAPNPRRVPINDPRTAPRFLREPHPLDAPYAASPIPQRDFNECASGSRPHAPLPPKGTSLHGQGSLVGHARPLTSSDTNSFCYASSCAAPTI